MITALVIRRLKTGSNGTAGLEQLAKVLDLPVAPMPGYIIVLDDDTELVIATVSMRTRTAVPGVYPPRVTIRTQSEPSARREAAIEAGWTPVAMPASSVLA